MRSLLDYDEQAVLGVVAPAGAMKCSAIPLGCTAHLTMSCDVKRVESGAPQQSIRQVTARISRRVGIKKPPPMASASRLAASLDAVVLHMVISSRTPVCCL